MAFVIMYVIALPLAYYLGFIQKLGVKGFWIAEMIGIYLMGILNTLIVTGADWQEVADEA